ncbi:hypothetical protein GCM10025863_27430 [Microbacterium suwonense]|uniref:Uncharacterized protein n=1 Tax=Microbacterium suwonense TaxID=683047 RepID=A0ABN6X650_9MICO|nr:hypothetical protein GCM10025863_27430 [Microbacterium suwonense]
MTGAECVMSVPSKVGGSARATLKAVVPASMKTRSVDEMISAQAAAMLRLASLSSSARAANPATWIVPCGSMSPPCTDRAIPCSSSRRESRLIVMSETWYFSASAVVATKPRSFRS